MVTLTYDLDLWTRPIYGQDQSLHQILDLYV